MMNKITGKLKACFKLSLIDAYELDNRVWSCKDQSFTRSHWTLKLAREFLLGPKPVEVVIAALLLFTHHGNWMKLSCVWKRLDHHMSLTYMCKLIIKLSYIKMGAVPTDSSSPLSAAPTCHWLHKSLKQTSVELKGAILTVTILICAVEAKQTNNLVILTGVLQIWRMFCLWLYYLEIKSPRYSSVKSHTEVQSKF